MDFAVLPPEVTSARMYSGSGSGPMVAAAAAWDRLAATLGSAAGSYRSVVLELTDESWQGPASVSMAAAANPYVEWMGTTAAQATATANQARAAAAAYEAAHAAVVPPPVIAANRAALSSLVTSNVLGQNSAAIAANQAEYGQMWAQNAAAMQTYAAGSAAATKPLTGFNAPPQTNNPTGGGQAGAAAASAQSALTDFLNDNALVTLMQSDPVQAAVTLASGLDTYWAGIIQQPALTAALFGFVPAMPSVAAISASQAFAGATGAIPAFAASEVTESEDTQHFTLAGSQVPGVGSPAASPIGAGGGEVSGGLGRAVPVGKLSVPPSWGGANAPGVRLAATALPAAGASAVPQAGMGMPGGCLGGMPALAGAVNTSSGRRPAGWSDSTLQVIPRLARAGGGDGDVHHPSAQPASDGADVVDDLSEHEERELDELRRAIAELTEKRDAAARSIREALR